MSPEQLSGQSKQVDTRSDVYQIGIVLFELLVGRTPWDLNSLSLPEAAVRMQSPPKRLASYDPRLAGDIETIVQKSLASEKERRYQSASELAADIDRYLRHLPITARPPSLMYQLKKFSRRHTTVMASIVAILITTIAAGYLIARYSYRQSIALQEAQLQTEITEEVNEFLNEGLLGKANPNTSGRHDMTVRELLDSASEKIESSFTNKPEVEAAIRFTLGRTYMGLGLHADAIRHLKRSADLRASINGQESEPFIGVNDKLAQCLALDWKLDESEPLAISNLRIARDTLGEFHAATASCYNTYAIVLKRLGRFEESEHNYRQAISILSQADDPKQRRVFNSTRINLALVLENQKKSTEANAILREVIRDWKDLVGHHPDTAFGLHTLASNLWEQTRRTKDFSKEVRDQKFDEAEELFYEALEMREELLGEEHPETCQTLYGIVLIQKGRQQFELALETLERVLKIRRKIYRSDEHLDITNTLNAIGTTNNQLERYEAAATHFESAFDIAIDLVGPDHYRSSMYMRNWLYTLRVHLKDHEAIKMLIERYQDKLTPASNFTIRDNLAQMFGSKRRT